MNLEFWKNIASLWIRKEDLNDLNTACQKGKEYGKILNAQTSVYRDDDIFDYGEDDEDGI